MPWTGKKRLQTKHLTLITQYESNILKREIMLTPLFSLLLDQRLVPAYQATPNITEFEQDSKSECCPAAGGSF